MIEVNAIDTIVNCAAYTDVEKAEGNFEEADLQNHIAVDNLAEAAREFGITLIHISTDYVSAVNHPNHIRNLTAPVLWAYMA